LGGETFFFGRVSVKRLGLLSFTSRKHTTCPVHSMDKEKDKDKDKDKERYSAL
jgi:hypothetical protein